MAREPENASDAIEKAGRITAASLTAKLMVFMVALVGAMGVLFYALVHQIFGQLSPSMADDLDWKTRVVARDIAQSSDLGILLADREMIARAADAHQGDEDIIAIAVVDPNGESLFHRGEAVADEVFEAQVDSTTRGELAYSAWSEAVVEGEVVGRVAVVASTERLTSGKRLEERMVAVALGAVLLALLIAGLFVYAYLRPLLRLREQASVVEQRRAAAEEATKLKSEFLANMSHEIRTPLNGVLGMTTMLSRLDLTERASRYVDTLHSSATALLALLNDILDFSKIEAGKLDIRASEMDLAELVEQVCMLLAARAHEKGVELVCDVEAAERVQGDPARVRQILANLIGNAIKFTESGGQVLVRVARQEDIVRFEVVDTGIGIDEAGQKKLFQAFEQATDTTRYGGTGLGLAICKRLAELMNGGIGVVSTPGEGSTFWVELPMEKLEPSPFESMLADALRGTSVRLVVDHEGTKDALVSLLRAHAAFLEITTGRALTEAMLDARPPDDDLVLIDGDLDMLDGAIAVRSLVQKGTLAFVLARFTALDVDPTHAIHKPVGRVGLARVLRDALREASGKPDSVPSGRRGLRLLIAEDNAVNVFVVNELLSVLGHRSHVVENGEAAVEAWEKGSFDAILMDCQMPVMDGYAATREIRAREEKSGASRIPIIATTAGAMADEHTRALEAGMDRYVTKPLRIEELDAALTELCAEAGPLHSEPPPAMTPIRSDRKVSPRLRSVFLEHSPQQLDELIDALAARDPNAVAAAAHKLKGSCRAVGAVRLMERCEELESLARDGRALTIDHDDLRSTFEATVDSLGTGPA